MTPNQRIMAWAIAPMGLGTWLPVAGAMALPPGPPGATDLTWAAVGTGGDRPFVPMPPDRLAQTPPVQRLPLPRPTPQPPLPPPEELLQPSPMPPLEVLPFPPASQPGEPVPTDTETTLVVTRFEVQGSTVFSPGELDAVLAPFTNRPLTLAELLQARSAVTQLYLDRGYVTSGAYIPPQEPTDGVVLIQVVEGRLKDIQVRGIHRLNPSYIRDRLNLGAAPPLNIENLVAALRLLQLDPLIKNISADLAAGLDPGTSILTVEVTEADSFTVDFFTNNNRSPLIGSWEQGLSLNEGNVTGFGDRLQASYFHTEGSHRLQANYGLPLNPQQGTLALNFEYTDSEVIAPPTDILDINSKSYVMDLSFRQPILRTPTEEVALSLIGSWEKSESVYLQNLLGYPVPFPSLGANANGQIEVFALRFAQDWVQRGSQEVLAARSQFSLGLGGSTPALQLPGVPDSQFFSWLAQAQWARLLAPDTLLLVRAQAQLANDSLPPQELFGLGGQQTVRGYTQDFLLTDNGLLASVEVRVPLYRDPVTQDLFQVVPFLDVGTGWNARLPNPDPNTLVGAGVGLQWSRGATWNARIDWGIPLVNDRARGNSWQANGIYFSINLRTF